MPDEETPVDQPEPTEFETKARAAFDENAKLRRENAFIRAGVDPESDQATLVAKLLSPDEFTPDAVRDTVKSLQSQFGGGDAKEPEPEDEGPTPEDLLEDPRRQAAQEYRETAQGRGQRIEEPPPADPVAEGYDRYEEKRRRGTPLEDSAHEVVGAIINDVVQNGTKSARAWEGWEAQQRKPELYRP